MMSAASVVMLNYCIQKGQKRTVEHLHGKTIYFPGFQHQRSNQLCLPRPFSSFLLFYNKILLYPGLRIYIRTISSQVMFKGQLILKGLFGILEIFQKNKQNNTIIALLGKKTLPWTLSDVQHSVFFQLTASKGI